MFSHAIRLGSLLPDGWMLRWSFAWEQAGNESAVDANTDTRCMRQVAEGNPDALQPLFERWKRPLITYFYRATGSHADAEDLTLTTFERVYRAADRYRPETRFSTWLFAVARNELLHELRRRRRKPLEALPPEELCSLEASGEVAHGRHTQELEEQLLHALQRLPERERSAILMTSSGELATDEAAAALKVSRTHFNVILHRARQALRKAFNNSHH